MLNDEEFDPEIVAEPILVRRETPLAGPRRKAGSSDTTVVWVVLILIASFVGSYALMRAYRTEPAPAPAQPKVVVADPAPPPRAKPAAIAKRPPTPAAKSTAPVVAHHVEPEKKFVDPIEGFDSGEAFDNPASPGRYGQRSSGLLQRSPAPARPNRPDPSFGQTPQ